MTSVVDLKGIAEMLGLLELSTVDGRKVFEGPEYDALAKKLVQAADRMLGWVLSDSLANVSEVDTDPSTGVAQQDQASYVGDNFQPQPAWVPPANVGQMPPTDLMGPQHQDFRQLFAGLGYDQIDSAMGKWQLPGLDSPYWSSTETAEDRKAKFARVAAQGGPGGPKAQQATQWTPPPPQAAQAPAQSWGTVQTGPACKKCGGTATRSSTVRKEGPNQGRAFRQCVQCNGFVAWGG